MSAFAHVVCIGPLSSKALASGSHKRAEIKHGPHSKTAAQRILCCMQGLHCMYLQLLLVACFLLAAHVHVML